MRLKVLALLLLLSTLSLSLATTTTTTTTTKKAKKSIKATGAAPQGRFRPCDAVHPPPPYCNTALSISERVQLIMSSLSLQEKIGQFGTTSQALPSVQAPVGYEWWNEGLHGVALSPGVHYDKADAAPSPTTIQSSTSFPQVIGIGASFDMRLAHAIGHAISEEARAMDNTAFDDEGHQHAGLTYWAPNINLIKDPRWGRGQETPGEDPYLNGRYAVAYITGMQQDERDPDHLKVSACCKVS
jgi:beta-glucosidase-like glycosyl hydrolase